MALNSEKIDRLSVWMVCCIGFVVVIGGIFQVRSHLFIHNRTLVAEFRERFAEAQDTNNPEDLFGNTEDTDNLVAKQTQDTDEDGLNDFDEEFLHSTSPYLADSDSDGNTDKQEIENETNPNCPEGTDCQQERTGDAGTEPTAAEEANSDLNGNTQITAAQQMTPDQLREELRKNGVNEDAIAQISDEELLQAYEESVAQTQKGANSVAEAQQYAEQVRNMTPEQKRQFLSTAGIPTEEIQKLNDDQLNQLFNEIIDETLQEQGVSSAQPTNTNTAAPAESEPTQNPQP